MYVHYFAVVLVPNDILSNLDDRLYTAMFPIYSDHPILHGSSMDNLLYMTLASNVAFSWRFADHSGLLCTTYKGTVCNLH